jgi:hypothetical protein
MTQALEQALALRFVARHFRGANLASKQFQALLAGSG